MFSPSFLPAVPDLWLESMEVDEHAVRLTTRVTSATACCPLCADSGTRVHSRYQRTLADLPCVGRIVRVLVQIRRFFCDNPACRRAIFAERLGSAVAVYARRTARQASQLERMAFAVGGEAGARLSTTLGLPTSASTLLRLQRRAALPPLEPPTVIGVDDFAFRKGQRYGTLIIDLERHRRIDVLPDREAATLAAWLRQQPQIAVISRDRATAYAEAAAAGAPQATQVADRFHLVKNAGEALQRVLQRHPAALRAAAQAHADVLHPAPAVPPVQAVLPIVPCTPAAPQPALTDREQRFRTVLELHAQGRNIQQIARTVQLNRRTVKGYILSRELPKRGGPSIQATSSITPYLSYVEHRWQAGCQDGVQLPAGNRGARLPGQLLEHVPRAQALAAGGRAAHGAATHHAASAACVLTAPGHVAAGAAGRRPGHGGALRAADAPGRECGDCHGG